eukprot:scaffold27859_cov55-Attheya_sp.AAC.6
MPSCRILLLRSGDWPRGAVPREAKWGIVIVGVIVVVVAERRGRRGSIPRWWAIAIERQSLPGSNRAALPADLRVTANNRDCCCDSHVATQPPLPLAPLVGLLVLVRRMVLAIVQS